MHDILFTPVKLGAIELANRIIMAPMTRDRAGPGDVPTDLMVEYYRQRAGAGLIITEGTQPSPEGKGYWRTPGIYTQEQIDGWARVAEAVHAEGGKIVMQLMHVGRVVVPSNRGYEAGIIAPSAIACADEVPGPDGVPVACDTPRAMTQEDIFRVTEEFVAAARNARAAGIDGVELHCASGYLVNQFLNSASNQRNDAFGGPPEQRVAFAELLLGRMADAIGANRVGVRISPGNPYNGMDPADPEPLFSALLQAADNVGNARTGEGLAYAHVIDMALTDLDTLAMVRSNWSGPIIANNNLKPESGSALLAEKRADAISFGRAFIANPDLPARIRSEAPLAKPDYAHLYTGDDKGYTDYPTL
ncbi:MAG: alkene reductase [Sphingorhabdus sp.]|uniref:alkene reductase n=1 Tax=Sphingorhabdus sp. TaxID=1902408 RepID=UPI003C904837